MAHLPPPGRGRPVLADAGRAARQTVIAVADPQSPLRRPRSGLPGGASKGSPDRRPAPRIEPPSADQPGADDDSEPDQGPPHEARPFPLGQLGLEDRRAAARDQSFYVGNGRPPEPQQWPGRSQSRPVNQPCLVPDQARDPCRRSETIRYIAPADVSVTKTASAHDRPQGRQGRRRPDDTGPVSNSRPTTKRIRSSHYQPQAGVWSSRSDRDQAIPVKVVAGTPPTG